MPIPWKPNTDADKEIETIKISKAKAEEEAAKKKAEESKGSEENATTEEFNQLASLLGQHGRQEENFQLNLFPERYEAGGVQGAAHAQEEPDDNMIHIDLG